jgi:hypothetical protein
MRSMPLSRTILLLAITLAGCWKVDPDLKVSTNELTFTPTTNELEFTVTNDSKDNALTSGVTDLEYQCKCDHAWLTVAPGSGRLREEESITHMVTVDRSRLSLGENLATITVTSNGGNETIEVHAVRTSGNCSSAPTAPTDPSPQDEVFGVDLSANLSWENGESQCEELNATYDVYFGELNPPPLVHNVGSEKSFDPGAMDASTLYYWRVVAKDANGSTAGAIWSFRTGSGTQCTEGPSAPSSLSPANDANDVPLTQNLSWSGGRKRVRGSHRDLRRVLRHRLAAASA